MSREQMKILQMVADGGITPEEGEKLLNRLEPNRTTLEPVERQPNDNGRSAPLKFLRVVVDGEDKVDIRLPIALIRTGIKLTALMPSNASEHLSAHGIDLSQFANLDGDELIEALRELHVDVDAGDGDVVRIFCE